MHSYYALRQHLTVNPFPQPLNTFHYIVSKNEHLIR